MLAVGPDELLSKVTRYLEETVQVCMAVSAIQQQPAPFLLCTMAEAITGKAITGPPVWTAARAATGLSDDQPSYLFNIPALTL